MSPAKTNGSAAVSRKSSNFTHFYIPSESIVGDQCRFSRDETNHILKSCRLYIGDTLHATDGKGHLYEIVLTSFDDRLVGGRIVKQTEKVNELDGNITLAFGLMPTSKTEQVIDQCTQLGVTSFMPLYTKHSLVALPEEKLATKVTRWQKVAISAMKQSLRTVTPTIESPKALAEFAKELRGFDFCLLASLKGRGSPDFGSLNKDHRVLLVTGPEEGFSRIEEENLIAAGAIPVSLGSRRLRAELAPVVLVSYFLARA
jgi:16S rRNA (uracil1498-N3)-methyltransferase